MSWLRHGPGAADAESAVRNRTLRAPSKVTIREAGDEWLEGARKGTVRNRSGDAYKPSAIRGYEAALRLRVCPEIGAQRVSDVSRADSTLGTGPAPAM